MEKTFIDLIENVDQNNEQINLSFLLEGKTLISLENEKSQYKFLDNDLKELKSLYKLTNENLIKISTNIRRIKEKYLREFTADIGIVYSNKYKKLLPIIIEELKTMSKKYSIKIICFSINDIYLENKKIYGILISPNNKIEVNTEFPSLIFNMGHYSKHENIRTMKHLRALKDVKLINPINRFNQAIIFDMISDVYDEKEKILPSYQQFNKNNLLNYLENNNKIILLPEKIGARGKGIIVTKKNTEYIISVGIVEEISNKDNLFILLSKIIQNKKYIICEAKKYITFNNLLAEARVYVQKDFNDQWSITKIICKNEIFSYKSIYKDKCEEIENVLLNINSKNKDVIVSNLGGYSIAICNKLENLLRDIGSCAIDYLITEDGQVQLINFAGWDGKEYLHRLNKDNIWIDYFIKAIDYLIFIKKNKVNKDDAI